MNTTRLKKLNVFIALSIFVSGFTGLSLLAPKTVSADAVAVTATPNEIAASTATEVEFTYTATTAVEDDGTTYTFIVDPALPSALDDCSSADGFADSNDTDGAGSFDDFSTSGAVFTTTTATTTSGRSFCLEFPSSATVASYGVSIVTSTGDFGAALVHYADNNDVVVSALVGPSLSFNIVNLADSADTNVCDLGSVDTTTTVDLDATDDGAGECGYALAIGTNSATGYTATIEGSANGLYNGSHTMDDVSGSFDTGTEEYGLANVTAGTGSTVDATYTGATGYPIPTTEDDFVTSAGAVDYVQDSDPSDTTTVMHGLTVAPSTPTGSYTQTITYQVTASF